MKRTRQTLEELLSQLAPVDTSWLDDHAEAVIRRLNSLPKKPEYTRSDLALLFDIEKREANTRAREHFDASLTIVRLFLDLSKDEFTDALRNQLGSGMGVKMMKQEPDRFFGALEDLGILERMSTVANTPITWTDLLVERLKGGRGSAIKGQNRGRNLEDFVESLVEQIFEKGNYDARCNFVGATGLSQAKADFAIPSKDNPSILIEVKAYGATGSKQTDVIGDINKITQEKRHDTYFLLVTDGVTWRYRKNDLRKIVTFQNHGKIYRIYTQSMGENLEADLKQLKKEHGL